MKSRLLIFFLVNLFVHCSFTLKSQTSVQGSIQDQNGKPIYNANIYISNSKLGTSSDKNGVFVFNNLPLGNYELIISHVAFKSTSKKIELSESNRKCNLKITLSEELQHLEDIEISEKKDRKWKKQLKLFSKEFLGTSENAKKCKILNPWVIDFQEENSTFSATADLPIQIINKATGYKIYFFLEVFNKKDNNTTYAGKPFFVELKTKNALEQQVWTRNRIITYSGSYRHFLKALYDKELKKEGFEIYRAKQNTQTQSMQILGQLNENRILKELDDGITNLYFKDFLQVVYTREREPLNYASNNAHKTSAAAVVQQFGRAQGEGAFIQDSHKAESEVSYQTSYLFARTKINIIEGGNLKNPQDLREYGYWAWERIAEILPLNIEFETIKKETKEVKKTFVSYPEKNGFLLSNLLLPKNELLSGGPVKDGIPAINKPIFVDQDDAKFLSDNDHVLGVEYNGLTKAYPVKIMNWHEIVNDKFENEPVVITYCPLCGSGMAFIAKNKSRNLTFGVSGLLYNSDVLLYDKETESLWSQILGKAISGKKSGEELSYIPTTYTTWGNWKMNHINSLVLTEDTGFDRNYIQSPYKDYESSDKLLFPVSHENNKIPKKEKVIGIELNGKYKAYSFAKLAKSKYDQIEDTFEGKSLIISYNKNAKAASVKCSDGKIFPSVTLYWFAWYAFHPETKIY